MSAYTQRPPKMPNLTPKPVREFTRDDQCTKVHLYNCFMGDQGAFVQRAVIEARGEIGVNAIKYLVREEYAQAFEQGGVDWWRLTREGEGWLLKGLARHLELHPEDRSSVKGSIGASAAKRPVRVARRTR